MEKEARGYFIKQHQSLKLCYKCVSPSCSQAGQFDLSILPHSQDSRPDYNLVKLEIGKPLELGPWKKAHCNLDKKTVIQSNSIFLKADYCVMTLNFKLCWLGLVFNLQMIEKKKKTFPLC